jgi:hypothetical protein
MTELTTTAITFMVAGLFGFLSLLVTTVFLWKVYKRGGRNDLIAAARALREARPRRLPGTGDRLPSLARPWPPTRSPATPPTDSEQLADRAT